MSEDQTSRYKFILENSDAELAHRSWLFQYARTLWMNIGRATECRKRLLLRRSLRTQKHKKELLRSSDGR